MGIYILGMLRLGANFERVDLDSYNPNLRGFKFLGVHRLGVHTLGVYTQRVRPGFLQPEFLGV